MAVCQIAYHTVVTNTNIIETYANRAPDGASHSRHLTVYDGWLARSVGQHCCVENYVYPHQSSSVHVTGVRTCQPAIIHRWEGSAVRW
jgi:hypothetical protein